MFTIFLFFILFLNNCFAANDNVIIPTQIKNPMDKVGWLRRNMLSGLEITKTDNTPEFISVGQYDNVDFYDTDGQQTVKVYSFCKDALSVRSDWALSLYYADLYAVHPIYRKIRGFRAQGITLNGDGSFIVFGQRRNNFFKRLLGFCEYFLEKCSVEKPNQNELYSDDSIQLPFECKKIIPIFLSDMNNSSRDKAEDYYILDSYGYLYKSSRNGSEYAAQKIAIQCPTEFFEMRFLDFAVNKDKIALLSTTGRVIEFSAKKLTSFKMSDAVFLQPQNFRLFFENNTPRILNSTNMMVSDGIRQVQLDVSQRWPIFNLVQKYWLKVIFNWKRIGCYTIAVVLLLKSFPLIPLDKFISFKVKVGAAIVSGFFK
jgi:hypothetical protein